MSGKVALVTGAAAGIAGAVSWLASDDASFVTGQVIGVNGGRYI